MDRVRATCSMHPVEACGKILTGPTTGDLQRRERATERTSGRTKLRTIERHAEAALRVALLVLCLPQFLPTAGEASPERRAGWFTRGLVVCDTQSAADAGIAELGKGGNAVDAAVAAAFALSVSFPWAAPIGGGGFAVVHRASGAQIAIDFRETAPGSASRDMFLGPDGEVAPGRSLQSLQAVAVPGSVDGLLRLWEDHGAGQVSRSELLAPAIALARDGIAVDHDLAHRLNSHRERLLADPSAAAIFCREDGPWIPGDLLRQPDLARTLERIAAEGRDGFYRGDVADALVKAMRNGNGLITHDDLESYRSTYRDPVRGSFLGHEIVSIGPPSSGGIFVIQLLRMSEALGIERIPWGSAAQIHLLTEMERRAYADRAFLLGDPDFVKVPVDRLIDPAYANARAAEIPRDHATPSRNVGPGLSTNGFERPQRPGGLETEGSETTHLSVVDSDGNAVAMTLTLNQGFGCARVVEGTGILLNNEMDDFSAKPGVPNLYGLIGDEANAIAPGKRPLSSMSPVLILEDGRPVLILGSPGGSRIITSVFQVILNVLAYGMPVAQAVAVPRVHSQWLPDELYYEPQGLSPETRASLEALGHTVRPFPDGALGRVNAIQITPEGYFAGPDIRGMTAVAGR